MTPKSEDSRYFITTAEFGRIAGIEERNARSALQKCNNGGQWRGTSLQARISGKGYLVDVRSLPPALFASWRDSNPDAGKPTIEKTEPLIPHYDPKAGSKSIMAAWKIGLIAEAIQHPSKSRDRAELLKEVAAAWHTRPDGKREKVSMRTLQDWIDKFTNGDSESLLRLKPLSSRYGIFWLRYFVKDMNS